MQVHVCFDGRGVITIFPECSPPTLALVVLLSGAAGDELHALGNHLPACIPYQKMNVIGGHHIDLHWVFEAKKRFGLSVLNYNSDGHFYCRWKFPCVFSETS